MALLRCCPLFAALLLIICNEGDGAREAPSLLIHNMDIDCRVTSRFAHTSIIAEIENQLNLSHEATFDVELPKTAFITNFTMIIDGVTTIGAVEKKAEADEQYERAVSRGQNAGLVQSIGRKMENFKISVNVGARATAVFTLTYEELLKRSQGTYQLQLKVKPKQLVENFQITVDIVEPQGIRFVNTIGAFMTNELMDAVLIDRSGTRARVAFKPTLEQQRKCPSCSETLLDGDFIIKYDVNREKSAGNVQIVNGYFVHYFAPSVLERVPKNMVFVIDSSLSMIGRKMKQTYEAFIKILSDLPVTDHFGILKFSSSVVKWSDDLVKATPDNIQGAKEFVKKIKAHGGTDINSALLSAATMLREAREAGILPEISASSIIFLSDGDPTLGETNNEIIMRNVKRAADGLATLYSLGFGEDVDYDFLEKMSLENGGLARRIYVDSDSALQLQDFYKEVANPTLLDVTLQYPNLPVSGLTQNSFKYYYQGSEIVVAGRIDSNDIDMLIAEVAAQGVRDPFSMTVQTDIKKEASTEQRYIFGDFTERLWAYLTIEQLLSKRFSSDVELKENSAEEALRLSLKYNFVTPLTSMVIAASDDSDGYKTIVAKKPKEEMMPYARTASIKKRVRPTHVGITINGKLAANKSGFDRIGLVHKKTMTMEVTAENITVTKGEDVQVYPWASVPPGLRFPRKEGDKLVVSLEPGLKLFISLVKPLDLLKLHVQSRGADSNSTIGLVSDVMSDSDIVLSSHNISIHGKTLPSNRFCPCDLTSFGGKTPGCCVSVTATADDLTAGASNIVQKLFNVPATA
ncbi:inter-alpha-trypsin inhibitor heavy chain H3-like isoform X6 [Phyllobates terribilis]|uniref:inter-alpha-trypsin inhibitor heavy chain H3-like isoform X6 n=1 Tax=Phyllobates terribilis TaxID=111132 RepID=UPI003CCACC87